MAGQDTYGNKYGTLYNYAAVSANTYIYPSNAAPEGVNAEYDLCPSGWRLPTGGEGGEYSDLLLGNGGIATDMDNTTTPTGAEMVTKLQRDFGFPIVGYFLGASSIQQQGAIGIYRTSTRSNANAMRTMDLTASTVTTIVGRRI